MTTMARFSGRLAIAMAAWAAIGAAVAASGSAADAQVQPLVNSGGPIVLGEQHEKPDAVHFDPVTGSVNLLARYDANTSDQGSTHERAAESLFEETATVESGGYVYHPNIFSFHVGVTGGLSQQLFDSSNASPQTDKTGFDSLYGWDISGTFLRNEYAPLTLYTRRFEQFIQRDFSPSERSTSTTYGANLDIRSRIVPTTFQVYHSDDTLTSLAPGVGYDLTQNVAQWHSEADPTANQKLIWDASFNNTYQAPNIGPSFTINSGDANLSHDISFGKDKASSLLSSINYTNQTGDIAFNRLRWSESLRLKHSEQFLTQYNYAFDRESFQGSEQTNHRLNAGFVHHLFESLTTSGNVGGALTDLGSGGNIEQFFSSLGFDYRKNVPFGVLLANLNMGYNISHTDQNGQPIQIINDSETFVDSLPIRLTRPLINSSSIVVKNAGGVPYTRNLDYTVVQRGDLIEIHRVLTGLIPADSLALLDYTVAPVPANTIDTTSLGVGVRYDIEKSWLKGLSPYARYLIQDQQVDSLRPQDVPIENIRATVIGADYHIWRLTFNAEHEWHDSSLLPFDAGRYSVRYEDRLSDRVNLSLIGGYTQYVYTDIHNHVNTLNAAAQVDARLSERWTLLGRITYLDDQDDLNGLTRGLEESVELRWKYRQTEIFGRARNANLEGDVTKQDFVTVEMGFRRTF